MRTYNKHINRNFWNGSQVTLNLPLGNRIGAWQVGHGKWQTERERRVKVGILPFHFYPSSLLDFFPLMFDIYKPTMLIKPLLSLSLLSTHLSETKEETLHSGVVLGNVLGLIALCNCISLIQCLCLPYDESSTIHLTF